MTKTAAVAVISLIIGYFVICVADCHSRQSTYDEIMAATSANSDDSNEAYFKKAVDKLLPYAIADANNQLNRLIQGEQLLQLVPDGDSKVTTSQRVRRVPVRIVYAPRVSLAHDPFYEAGKPGNSNSSTMAMAQGSVITLAYDTHPRNPVTLYNSLVHELTHVALAPPGDIGYLTPTYRIISETVACRVAHLAERERFLKPIPMDWTYVRGLEPASVAKQATLVAEKDGGLRELIKLLGQPEKVELWGEWAEIFGKR